MNYTYGMILKAFWFLALLGNERFSMKTLGFFSMKTRAFFSWWNHVKSLDLLHLWQHPKGVSGEFPGFYPGLLSVGQLSHILHSSPFNFASPSFYEEMINWNEGIQHVQPFWARIPTPETLPSEGQVPFSKTKPIFHPAPCPCSPPAGAARCRFCTTTQLRRGASAGVLSLLRVSCYLLRFTA